jgi:hypothetical protein
MQFAKSTLYLLQGLNQLGRATVADNHLKRIQQPMPSVEQQVVATLHVKV